MPAALFVIFAGALAIAAFYPAWRVVALAVVAIFGALAGWFLLNPVGEAERAAGRISPSEVRLIDLSLTDSGTTLRLEGRVANDASAFRLRRFAVRLILRDCPSADSPPDDCAIVADGTATAETDVPPAQVRDVVIPFRFPGRARQSGELIWQAEVTGAGGIR
jgi:hypothetical protein